ncbi:MAG: ribonuclease P protein component [Candidatus Terrybacteria bacterium CG10_big_fil_rev_8_21_14_0_10_41_10]|uniref:Ribonuclease P protein component n=1 Tax=Candidatus Terrybacteria bacterium CG10_big_fil_rev_8_21_14_0_10_41_10 TaxID=1975026 RepID=A0A2M8LA63_9BACT|nr:MAG: ribonuclease P protein component [Candidatus Terrybacteria bacterium CG10_big_fil_rev_8_21_14_0_10_41_10]
MLSKKNRLTKDLIEGVIKTGKRFSTDNIFLKISKIGQEDSLFTFVVISGATKKATTRNKLKRRARYAAKCLMGNIKGGLAIVVFFQKTAINKGFSEIKEEMTKLFKKAGIITL